MGILDFDVGLGLGVMDVTKKEVGNYTPAEEVGMDCNSSSLVLFNLCIQGRWKGGK